MNLEADWMSSLRLNESGFFFWAIFYFFLILFLFCGFFFFLEYFLLINFFFFFERKMLYSNLVKFRKICVCVYFFN